MCSKSEQKFSFLTKPQLRNLQQIVANTILISNSYNINKFWVGIFTRQGSHQSSLLNRSELVSEWVSYWQAFPMIGLGSDKNTTFWQNLYRGGVVAGGVLVPPLAKVDKPEFSLKVQLQVSKAFWKRSQAIFKQLPIPNVERRTEEKKPCNIKALWKEYLGNLSKTF